MQSPQPVDIKQVIDSCAASWPGLDAIRLERYVAEIVRWNDRIGLVSKQRPLDVIRRLIDRSMVLQAFAAEQGLMDTAPRTIDIGAGAGFPGVIWKLHSPTLPLTLVERKLRKGSFLERLPALLDLDGLEVFVGDAADLSRDPAHAGRYDLAAMLAVGSLGDNAGVIAPLLKPGGVFATVRPQQETSPAADLGHGLSLASRKTLDDGVAVLYRHTGA